MTAKTMWMVRAGEAGFRFEEFKDGPLVSIGWLQMGDMRSLKSREDFQKAVVAAYPTAKKRPGRRVRWASLQICA